MRKIVIFDVDGTLTLLGDRKRLVEGPNKNYTEFYDRVLEDKPNLPVIDALESFRLMGHKILIFTGRTDRVRDKTIEQLAGFTSFSKEELEGPMLTMRPHGNNKADHLLKEEWLRNMLQEDVDNVVCVYDDRQAVVNMWRQNGMPCLLSSRCV